MAIRKCYSFTDKNVVEWIDKNGKSKYISQLVLEDMNREGYVTKGEVVRLIEEGLKNYKGNVNNKVDENLKQNALSLLSF
jgi:ribosomal protein L35AE/L33A